MEKNSKRWKRYQYMLCILLLTGLLAIPVLLYYEIYSRVPGNIMLRSGLEQRLDFEVPVSGELYREDAIPAISVPIQLNKPVTILAGPSEQYKMNLRLFGMIPLKHVDVQVIEDRTLIPAGIPIGIYVKTEGVLVIGTGKFKGIDGLWQEPAVPVLQAGDYIEAIDGVSVYGKRDFVNRMKDCKGEEVILTVNRNQEEIPIRLQPAANEMGEYKAGIWIRDSAQGIGTLTYLDSQGRFGALGHGINDMDTSSLMSLEYGTLYQTKILSVNKGENGKPGELTGVIQYMDENILGEIAANTTEGIFGICNEQLAQMVQTTALPIGLKQEIEIGPAQILCTIDGQTQSYQVAINKVDYVTSSVNRGILLEVTDPRLLSETGGIVQGMSGSPIIQNGKIIGAVTHVLVQDSTKGYGVFIENMLESMNQMTN
ncbi:MAG: SpoIVB peptidase [Lachnospiraceae bacterium]